MTRRAQPCLVAALASLAMVACRGRAPPPPLECPILDCADDNLDGDGGASLEGEGEGEGVDAGVARLLPRNLILFLGDGMGAEQQRAARIFKNGDTAPLAFEALAQAGCVRTSNASGGVTDSAAAAT
ncbi:MAG: alkaline phosphatase, partial [Deltaproteobacteria bacterium]|nr:alkaline phosphatase [Deltaproteobacteria bacterium]